MFSILSTPISEPHEFDRAFAAAISPFVPGPVPPLPIRALRSWLESLARPLGESLPLYGNAPVHMKAVRCSPACATTAPAPRGSVCIEFIVHRYVDWHGVHYTTEVTLERPFRMFGFRSVGLVPSNLLWSLDREQAYERDGVQGC
jgi:hypothetical protein